MIADLHGLYLISDAHMDVATADALFGSEGAEAFAHPAVTRRVADLETRRPRRGAPTANSLQPFNSAAFAASRRMSVKWVRSSSMPWHTGELVSTWQRDNSS
ncbi:hypothetical protein ACETU7_30130 [Rhodococcus sp. 3Y1]